MKPKSDKVTFLAEVIEVKSKKTASLDVSYRVVLQTNDMDILSLGTLDGDTMVNVSIDIEK